MAETIEQYFLEDYKRLKAEVERLQEALDERDAEWGVRDLGHRYKTLSADAASTYALVRAMKEGDLSEDEAESIASMSDADVVAKYSDRKIPSYYSERCIKLERKEFQYTLRVKESRDEYILVTDGEDGCIMYRIDDTVALDRYVSSEFEEELKALCAEKFRENVASALEDYRKGKKE